MLTAQIETTKADAIEIARIKRFFMILELMAHSPEEFDVNDHFNVKDESYEMLSLFQKDGKFDFQGFLALAINNIGTGFSRVINGYEELIEKYCDPESLVLEPLEKIN